tara:strand:+ start:157 stop:357 length:201 start_codon:yes stop_codon:yes gene_type:complete
MNDDKENMPRTYHVVAIDKWGNQSIYRGKSFTDPKHAQKIRDNKMESSKLLDTGYRYAVGSIQPFL